MTAGSLTEYVRVEASELPPQIDVEQAAQRIVELHRRQRGATFSLYFGDTSGQPLYAVSVFNERSKLVLDEKALASFLRRFIRDNMGLLVDPRNSIGTWYDVEGGVTWLDVTSTLPDRQEAEALGRQYNQRAIFSLMTGEEIDTGGTGEELPGWLPEAERLPEMRRGKNDDENG